MVQLRVAAASAALVGLLVCATPGHAQTAHRAWVSGHGVDAAGCGAPSAPCRSLQYAHDHIVASGGEIDVLDPAGYGAIAITKAISIVNDGVGTAGVQATSGSAIAIAAGLSDEVYLRGLTLDGVNGGGAIGIDFQGGGGLIIDHCVVRHFNAFGVQIEPTSGASSVGVYDSLFADDNTGFDVLLSSGTATVKLAANRVIATANNNGGIAVETTTAGASVVAVVSNGDASNNGTFGMAAEADAGSVVMEINGSTLDNNLFGFWALTGAKSHLSRSVLDANVQYGVNNAVSGSGVTFTAQNNDIEGNNVPVSAPMQVDTLH